MATRQDKVLAKASEPTATPTPQPRQSLVRAFASRLGVEPDKMLSTLKDTAFRQPGKDGKPGPEITDAQMMALLVVSNEYRLNPFLKEIYAFPAKGGAGIVPVVSVDGWIRICNSHPAFRSMEFHFPPDGTAKDDYYVECTIVRSDRDVPIVAREYLAECWRDTDPWRSHPRRMTRHKALIQCARIAFGFAGIYDPDEAERIANSLAIDAPHSHVGKPLTRAPQARQIAVDAPAQTQPLKPAADAVADEHGEFQSLASEPSEAEFEDEEDAGARG